MIRKGNKFTFNGEELTMLYVNLGYALQKLTDHFYDEKLVKLYQKEINLLNEITETL
tara:strand:- start:67 stop:237 length:171 start_codon:yes stop_codon:yes gene_type:complete